MRAGRVPLPVTRLVARARGDVVLQEPHDHADADEDGGKACRASEVDRRRRRIAVGVRGEHVKADAPPKRVRRAILRKGLDEDEQRADGIVASHKRGQYPLQGLPSVISKIHSPGLLAAIAAALSSRPSASRRQRMVFFMASSSLCLCVACGHPVSACSCYAPGRSPCVIRIIYYPLSHFAFQERLPWFSAHMPRKNADPCIGIGVLLWWSSLC